MTLTCNTRDADYVVREMDAAGYEIIDARSGLVVNAGLSIDELSARELDLNSMNGRKLKFRSEYELLRLDAEEVAASQAPGHLARERAP